MIPNRRRPSVAVTAAALGVVTSAACLVAACAVNPATGERQLSFIGEEREIRMGREAHPDILASMGTYPDSALQAYVSELGHELAALSERPELPWTFTVVDDEVVNAFALPGGYIYLTRGILAHFESEAELAAVLGHEIGHVTARHSVNQISRAQLAQVGLGVGTILVPELRPFEDVAGAGLQLAFLKFGRDDERQADDLGYRYMTRAGYDPREMVDVFRMLGQVSGAGGGERVPGWLSTHPDPENREERIRERVAADTSAASDRDRVRAREYLRRIDGIVYGQDPRQGFFVEQAFYHPELAFRLDFPPGWSTANQRSAVQAVSPDEDALAILSLADRGTPDAALRAFLGREGIRSGPVSDRDVNGLDASWAEFAAAGDGSELRGLVGFVALRDQVYRLLGAAPTSRWSARRETVRDALESFRPLDDPDVLSVEPARVRLVELERALPFAEFLQRYPSSIPDERVALLNQAEPTDTLEAGALVKRVTGGEIPPLP